MAQMSRSWWGQKFIEALESFTDPARLSRGRSYATEARIKSFTIQDQMVIAQVRGNVNPYFEVYKEPLYTTTIEFNPITPAKWSAVIAYIASKAGFISRLLLNEIPENIEDAFATLGLHLLPRSQKDFKTSCSCPDFSNPCKHIAGVHYWIAAQLDRDPFLLFELRGLSREALKIELAKSPLGKALAADLAAMEQDPVKVTHYFSKPQIVQPTSDLDLKDFWQGQKHLPQGIENSSPSVISGLLIKKQGDFPSFWQRDNSFIAAMEELYQRVKNNPKGVF
ncbi:MAG: hypothetical protein HC921_01405 [Synechococcaceae cyanobacterium SM2_3_1]|nr:hypothetical protein [Synechococcaceae cyanobacterium SM2_3_1]